MPINISTYIGLMSIGTSIGLIINLDFKSRLIMALFFFTLAISIGLYHFIKALIRKEVQNG